MKLDHSKFDLRGEMFSRDYQRIVEVNRKTSFPLVVQSYHVYVFSENIAVRGTAFRVLGELVNCHIDTQNHQISYF